MLGIGNSLVTGGVSADWTPLNISSLSHWYRYDTAITKDGDSDVTKWEDQKGSNDVTASGTNTNSPLYSSGAIVFNHSGDILTFDVALELGKFSTYFRVESSDLSGDVLIEGNSSNFFKIESTTEMKTKIGGERFDWDMSDPGVDTKITLGMERAANGDTTCYLNGSALTLNHGDGNVAVSTTFDPTRMGQPAVTAKFYEVLIFADSLSSSDRSDLHTYLGKI